MKTVKIINDNIILKIFLFSYKFTYENNNL